MGTLKKTLKTFVRNTDRHRGRTARACIKLHFIKLPKKFSLGSSVYVKFTRTNSTCSIEILISTLLVGYFHHNKLMRRLGRHEIRK